MMPISFMEDNRFFDIYGNSYALLVLDSIPYAFTTSQKKTSEIRRLEGALGSYFGEFSLYMYARQLSPKQLSREMMEYSNNPGWHQQVKVSTQHFKDNRPFTRKNFLLVPLKKRVNHLRDEEWSNMVIEFAKNSWRGVKDAKDRFQDRIFSSDIVIPKDVLESSRIQASKMLRDHFPYYRGIRSANVHETEWWLKKTYYRGLNDPELSIPSPFPALAITKSGKQVIRPIRNSILSLSDVTVKEKMNHLQIHHSSGDISYQSFFCTTNVPNNISEERPINKEWIYGVIEKIQFPVDVVIHTRIEKHTEAREKVKRKNKIAKSQVREYQEGEEDDAGFFGQSSIPEELLDDLEAIDSLRKKFRVHSQPLAYTTTIFGIGADSYDGLRDRVVDFKTAAEKLEHILVSPPSDMKKMFQSYYPFGQSLPQSWEIPMDPGILAAGMPLGIRMLGDPTGFPLGRLLTTGKVVFMDPKRPMLELQKSGAILICGDLGSGKTVLLKLLIYILLQWNAYCFANDPKGDWKYFFKHPEVRKVGKLISFTPDSDTLFTPFRLAKTKGQSYEAALGVMELIFNKDNTEIRNLAISEALDRLYLHESWDMFTFEEIIIDMENNHENEEFRREANFISRRIKSLPNHPIGRMIFGRDEGQHLFEEKRFICAITRGLAMPSKMKTQDQWSENERYSIAMLYAIISMAIQYLNSLPNTVLKGLAWEEFWFLNRFEKGRQIYDEALRLSRSEQMVVMMASQNPTDAPSGKDNPEEDITGLFGWKFMLRMNSKSQVQYALHDIMEMVEEDADDWLETFSEKYSNGMGLVKDPEGRIGEIQIEIIDKDLFPYLQSTPGKDIRYEDKNEYATAME